MGVEQVEVEVEVEDKEDYKRMRQLAADYMREHVDDYLPFIASDTDDMLTPGTCCVCVC